MNVETFVSSLRSSCIQNGLIFNRNGNEVVFSTFSFSFFVRTVVLSRNWTAGPFRPFSEVLEEE